MPKYVQVAAHLTPDELEQYYRQEVDPVERSHFQIIWLLACGKRVREVAEVTGYCANWIRILVRRYNQEGPTTLADQRQHNSGASPLLSEAHRQQLQHLLEQAPPDGGLWTGPKIARWMGEQLGRTIHPQRGWEYLKRMGFSLQVPRPRHHKADPAQQEAFKRELPEQVQQVQQAHPAAQVELWAMDEHRVGLKPIIRRVWALRGHRPIIRVQHRYEWLYVYGFVHPESGESQWLLLPSVNVEVFSIALAQFAQAVGAGPDRHVILILDRAGWLESGEVVIPTGIHLVFLPPYSPELQPCERLWPLSNEAIANCHFKTFDELQEVQAQHCITLQNDRIGIRHITLFHWWPTAFSYLKEGDLTAPQA
jgi:transposase